MPNVRFKNDYEMIKEAQSGNNEAMETIYLSNIGLIKSIAARFLNRGVEFDDLVQIGSIGMIKAIKGFDHNYNCVFSTYAVPLIIGEIKRFLRDDGLIKISRSIKKNAKDIGAFIEDYKKINGNEPTIDIISSSLELSAEDIVYALNSTYPIISLFEKKEDDSASPEDMIGEDTFEKTFDNIFVNEIISSLSEYEKVIIKLRHFKGLTQMQTAKVLGVSQVKVSRDEKKIFDKIKLHFLS